MRPIPKIPITKRPGRVAQGEGPEFKSQYQKKKKKSREGDREGPGIIYTSQRPALSD
jgi:hypothetical protein